jgi:hypothetical protein
MLKKLLLVAALLLVVSSQGFAGYTDYVFQCRSCTQPTPSLSKFSVSTFNYNDQNVLLSKSYTEYGCGSC